MYYPTSNDDNKMTSTFQFYFFTETHPYICLERHNYMTKESLQVKNFRDNVLKAMSQKLSYGDAHFYHVLHRLLNFNVGAMVWLELGCSHYDNSSIMDDMH